MSKPKVYTYGRQNISAQDLQAVTEVLSSDWLTQGPQVAAFEKKLCDRFGARFASATANGTASLHLLALALGWKRRHIVLTSPITFLASANCAIYAGANVDFVDIHKRTYTMDTRRLEEKIKHYMRDGIRIRAVVAVDFAGQPCDWPELRRLADQYGFQLVNDACHALGATLEGEPGYAARWADAVNMSFHPVKHITTGEGGAILTNDGALDEKIRLLRSHGMTRDPNRMEENDGPWYYEMQELGFNYRITDMQCALGISQLERLDAFVARRRQIAAFYDKAFSDDERFFAPYVASGREHAYHLYPLQIRFQKLKITRKELYFKLKEKNIVFQVHYIPVHLQPFYRKRFGFKPGDFPVAEAFYQNEVSIPMYPALTDDDLQYIVTTIKGALI